MLHGCGFTTLFACCDEASANRSFMVMNGVTTENSSGQNCFSRKPIFYIVVETKRTILGSREL